eukprot:TRINITY_DN105864_c0_g1_i1.p1 TRINITY_DN105864_c0_g1~~TRINITY_DN105864_c0_g1_i1.p1  ORF type:complete len:212 (-),score=20.13 TRINITY_DN105864_c0_g1_i1:37-672(-)
MSRVGSVDFKKSNLTPTQTSQYVRESIHRATWDHPFHALHESLPRPSYKDLCPTSKDAQSQPWRHLKHSSQVGTHTPSMSYIECYQVPRGLSREDLNRRPVALSRTQLPVGQEPVEIATLPWGVSAQRISSSLPMAAKMATMRGETDLGRSDKAPTIRAQAHNYTRPGWGTDNDLPQWNMRTKPGFGTSSMPTLHAAPRHRQPSFTRIFNA